MSNVCAVKFCIAKSPQGRSISLFRFPKDLKKCRQWAIACKREELLDRVPCLYSSYYRVCSKHFENVMFLNNLKNRLQVNAVPTLLLEKHQLTDFRKQQLSKGSPSTSTAASEKAKPCIEEHSYVTSTQQEGSTQTILITGDTDIPLHIEIPKTSGSSEERQLSNFRKRLFEDTPSACKKLRFQEEHSYVVPSNQVGTHTPIESPLCLSNLITSPKMSPNTTQTGSGLTSKTPRKEKLRSRLKKIQKHKRQLQNRIKSLEDQLKTQNSNTQKVDSVTSEEFKLMCDKFFPPQSANFMKLQVDLARKKARGRRYTNEFKQLCMKLYFTGPKAYRSLANTFVIPTSRSLRKLTEKLKICAGFNDTIFHALQAKVESFTAQDKFCTLCLDEMAIKAHLFYHIGYDEIFGFEDYGEEKIFRPALNVLVVMVKGIFHNWKQPLAYFFVHNTCSENNLKNLVQQCIVKLKNIGLFVKVLVCDMGASNIALSNILSVSPEHPTFSVDNENIAFMFDVPHLIKATRNNLLLNSYNFSGKSSSWQHVVDFYDKEKLLLNRLAPKLTDSHIHPSNPEKMKVSLAVHVLSASVAAAMTTYINVGLLPSAASATVEIIEKFDKLFDICNFSRTGNAKQYNRAFKGEKYQMDFLMNMLHFLRNLKVVNKQGKDITNLVKSIKCWQISINGLLYLWDDLKYRGFDFILTRRINQDSLENFFGAVRQQGGNCINPTPIQFHRAFQKLFTADLLHSGYENCSADLEKILNLNLEVGKLTTQNQHILVDTDVQFTTTNPIILQHTDYHCHDIEKNSIRYTSGYLIRKCLRVHTCDTCETYANDHKDLDDSTLFAHFKAYCNKNNTFGKLYMPNDNFFYHICELEQIFKNEFKTAAVMQNVLVHLKQSYELSILNHPCEQFPKQYLIDLYSRMRLFYCLKFTNRNFKITNEKGQRVHRKTIIWRHD